MSLVVLALSWERRVCVCVDSSPRCALPFGGWETFEVWREGRVELRYSAGSKLGFRKGWRGESDTWGDLGTYVIVGTAFCWAALAALLGALLRVEAMLVGERTSFAD